MTGAINPTGFSASVRIWLRSGTRMIPLTHSSSTFVIAREPVDLPAGDAEIILEVDGTHYERPIILPGGMRSDAREALVSSRDEYAPF